jgi:hypothetical protein
MTRRASGSLCATAAGRPSWCRIFGLGVQLTTGRRQHDRRIARSPGRDARSDDGGEIWLTLYSQAAAVPAIALDPVRAIRLGGRLITAGLLRRGEP